MPYGGIVLCPKVMTMITQPAGKNSIYALAITVLGLISACSSAPPKIIAPDSGRANAPATPSIGQRAAIIAREQVGVPYRYGGNSPNGFDCSGLVQYSYSRAGMRIPRTTGQLWSATHSVARNDLQTGDLLFFSIDGKMSHVGLYVGGQRFVHAPSSGRTVTVASLDSPYYDKAFIRAGRPR